MLLVGFGKRGIIINPFLCFFFFFSTCLLDFCCGVFLFFFFFFVSRRRNARWFDFFEARSLGLKTGELIFQTMWRKVRGETIVIWVLRD